MKVWAVIAHYGDPAATLAAVHALREGALQPDQIAVVDNQGGFAQTGVRVISPGRNLGFAGAIRLGAIEALEAGADWVWFLNNDARVSKGCLSALLAAGEDVPLAGLLSPVIEHDDGGIWYAGGRVDGQTLRVGHETTIADDHPYDTGYATGCAIMTRAAFLRDAGPADTDLFMYFEDVDWSLRARARGWRVMVVPAARVRHGVARRGKRRVWSTTAVYLLTRNRLLLARRTVGVGRALAPTISWGLKQCLKGIAWRDGGATSVAFLAGLRDGLHGRCGPPPTRFSERRP